MRLLRDIALIPLPFAVLSILFFIREVPKMGIGAAVIALLALWYVRPRTPGEGPPPTEGLPVERPVDSPGAGGGIGPGF